MTKFSSLILLTDLIKRLSPIIDSNMLEPIMGTTLYLEGSRGIKTAFLSAPIIGLKNLLTIQQCITEIVNTPYNQKLCTGIQYLLTDSEQLANIYPGTHMKPCSIDTECGILLHSCILRNVHTCERSPAPVANDSLERLSAKDSVAAQMHRFVLLHCHSINLSVLCQRTLRTVVMLPGSMIFPTAILLCSSVSYC